MCIPKYHCYHHKHEQFFILKDNLFMANYIQAYQPGYLKVIGAAAALTFLFQNPIIYLSDCSDILNQTIFSHGSDSDIIDLLEGGKMAVEAETATTKTPINEMITIYASDCSDITNSNIFSHGLDTCIFDIFSERRATVEAETTGRVSAKSSILFRSDRSDTILTPFFSHGSGLFTFDAVREAKAILSTKVATAKTISEKLLISFVPNCIDTITSTIFSHGLGSDIFRYVERETVEAEFHLGDKYCI